MVNEGAQEPMVSGGGAGEEMPQLKGGRQAPPLTREVAMELDGLVRTRKRSIPFV